MRVCRCQELVRQRFGAVTPVDERRTNAQELASHCHYSVARRSMSGAARAPQREQGNFPTIWMFEPMSSHLQRLSTTIVPRRRTRKPPYEHPTSLSSILILL